MPKDVKTIVFRYNGDAKSDEEEFDKNGETPRFVKDQIIERKGKKYKVAVVNDEFTVAGPKQVPIHRVYLVDAN